MTDQQTKTYYIAKPSYWPLMGAGGLFANVFGLVQCLHGNVIFGAFFILIGVGLLIATLFGWFGAVIHESLAGLHSRQMDRSYRFGMLWFIVSEIALFGVFSLFILRPRLWYHRIRRRTVCVCESAHVHQRRCHAPLFMA